MQEELTQIFIHEQNIITGNKRQAKTEHQSNHLKTVIHIGVYKKYACTPNE